MPMNLDDSSPATGNGVWVTDSDVADPTPLPTIFGTNVLIRPVPAKTKSKGGILFAGVTMDAKELEVTIGRVLALGPLAFTRREDLVPRWPSDTEPRYMVDEGGMDWKVQPWYKAGDLLVYPKYAGRKLKYGGVRLLVLEYWEPFFGVPNQDLFLE